MMSSVFVVLLLQDNSRAPGSPTSLTVPPNGGCEDLDMETEEEDDLRARGQFATKRMTKMIPINRWKCCLLQCDHSNAL